MHSTNTVVKKIKYRRFKLKVVIINTYKHIILRVT